MKRRRLSTVALAFAVAAAALSPVACGESTKHPPPLDTDREGGSIGTLPGSGSRDARADQTASDAAHDGAVDAAPDQDAVADAPDSG
jgi:hypothetical protein